MQKKSSVSGWMMIKGERIRRHYFNFILMLTLLVGCMVLIINAVCLITGKQIMTDLKGGVAVLLKLLLVWASLFLLNIFCVGKTVCILTSEGLYCEHGFYKWERMQRMEFHLPGVSRSKIIYASVQLIGKDLDAAIPHAPLYLLLRAKKYSPETKGTLSKADIIGMLCVALAVIAMSALIGITS